jgi:hypothetical protein
LRPVILLGVRDRRIAAGLGLIAVAVVVPEVKVRTHVLPNFSDWAYFVVFLVLVWAGGTLVVRAWRSKYAGGGASGRRVRPLKPGESYDRPVKLTIVPNVPIAELWRQRLRQEGIEAFFNGSLLRNPSVPVTLWVGEHDLDRARKLFPELQRRDNV